MSFRVSYDADGTPGLWADDWRCAYEALGYLHGKHRPLQVALLTLAGSGHLAERLIGRDDLVHLDSIARRLDLAGRAKQASRQLDEQTRDWLDAYLNGVRAGIHRAGKPFALRLLGCRIPEMSPQTVLAALMLSAYLGLAQSQERMERAIINALAAGADADLLETLFAPSLEGWDPERLRQLPPANLRGMAARTLPGLGGSNAWAVAPERTRSGAALLAGDPHLQINQLPALFFEVRGRIGNDYWLGASIPGLPGIAVGRNRNVAWSGTFACADNSDFTIETLDKGGALRPEGKIDLVVREEQINRRFKKPLRVRFFASDRGTLEDGEAQGSTLACAWSGCGEVAESLGNYMRLPTATSAAEAETHIRGARTLSLHFVLADRGGDTRYVQGGRIPKRSDGWSGLYPAAADRGRWLGFYEGDSMPAASSEDGIIVSANEPRSAVDGAALATMAQPDYRLRRISQRLKARRDHDVATMQRLQGDLCSLQAKTLAPLFARFAPSTPLADLLAGWQFEYTPESRAAHAFSTVYRAAWDALAPELGGEWLRQMLDGTELSVWWMAAFDRLLVDFERWPRTRQDRLGECVRAVCNTDFSPWGEVQQLTMRHIIAGGLPGLFGFDRGPMPLSGSPATVCQGNLLNYDGNEIAVGPAYRFVTDLSQDVATTCLPGGIDESRFSATYCKWLSAWQDRAYHTIAPPAEDERPAD